MTQPSDTIKTWATDVGVRPPVAGSSNVQAALTALGSTLRATDFLITERPTAGVGFPIVAVDTGAGTFTVAGNHVSRFVVCDWFTVEGSTGNDGTFVITTVTYNAGPDQTVLTTSDTISDATADGDIYPSQYRATFNLPAGATLDQIELYPLAIWAADNAHLWIFDGTLIFSPGVALDNNNPQLFPAYDPEALTGTLTQGAANWGNLVTLPSYPGQSVTGNLASNLNNAGIAGIGFRTATARAIDMTVTTSIAAPPVVPTGLTLIRCKWWPAVTPIMAVFA